MLWGPHLLTTPVIYHSDRSYDYQTGRVTIKLSCQLICRSRRLTRQGW